MFQSYFGVVFQDYLAYRASACADHKTVPRRFNHFIGDEVKVVNLGSPHQTSKIVRLGLLRKPVAFRKPIAIPLCNAKCGAFLQVEDRCNNLRFRNELSGNEVQLDALCATPRPFVLQKAVAIALRLATRMLGLPVQLGLEPIGEGKSKDNRLEPSKEVQKTP